MVAEFHVKHSNGRCYRAPLGPYARAVPKQRGYRGGHVGGGGRTGCWGVIVGMEGALPHSQNLQKFPKFPKFPKIC